MYGVRDFIERTIDSLLQQDTDRSHEIIVVDDGNTDDTNAFIKQRYQTEINSGKVILVTKENGGISSARNAGLKVARGEYISFLDGDDLALPNRLEDLASALDRQADVGLVHARANTLTIDGREVTNHHYVKARDAHSDHLNYNHLRSTTFIHGQTVMFRREVLTDSGNLDEALNASEDRDLWLRILSRYNSAFVDKHVALYRAREGQCTSRNLGSRQMQANVVRNKMLIREQYGFNPGIVVFASPDQEEEQQQKSAIRELFMKGISKILYVKKVENGYEVTKVRAQDVEKLETFGTRSTAHRTINGVYEEINAEDYQVVYIRSNEIMDTASTRLLSKRIRINCKSIEEYTATEIIEDATRDYFSETQEKLRAGIRQREQKDYNTALKTFNEVLQRHPRNQDAYVNIAIVNRDLGNKGVAKTYFEKTLEVNPNHRFARENLRRLD